MQRRHGLYHMSADADFSPFSTRWTLVSEEEAGGEIAEHQHDTGFGKRNLPLDERPANGSLGSGGHAVARRAPWDDRGDHHRGLAAWPIAPSMRGREATRPSGEGKALAIVVGIRHWADDHDAGGTGADLRDRRARRCLEARVRKPSGSWSSVGQRWNASTANALRSHSHLEWPAVPNPGKVAPSRADARRARGFWLCNLAMPVPAPLPVSRFAAWPSLPQTLQSGPPDRLPRAIRRPLPPAQAKAASPGRHVAGLIEEAVLVRSRGGRQMESAGTAGHDCVLIPRRSISDLRRTSAAGFPVGSIASLISLCTRHRQAGMVQPSSCIYPTNRLVITPVDLV